MMISPHAVRSEVSASQLHLPRLTRPSLYYGWVMLILAAFAMSATLPGRTHGLGLIAKPFRVLYK